ncbi:hypothetical protein B0H13DRAFT_2280198 [Mycena leptocephala]|nr:hypothetical protein B0H13DRAFT_2280198 [Mycena leptocephala]
MSEDKNSREKLNEVRVDVARGGEEQKIRASLSAHELVHAREGGRLCDVARCSPPKDYTARRSPKKARSAEPRPRQSQFHLDICLLVVLLRGNGAIRRGIERSPANAPSQSKIQRKLVQSPKVIFEEHHRPVPHIVQHPRWESERINETKTKLGGLGCEKPTCMQCAQCAVPAESRPGTAGKGASYEDAYNAAVEAASPPSAPLAPASADSRVHSPRRFESSSQSGGGPHSAPPPVEDQIRN